MVRTTIKAAYSLAPDVVAQLERLAKSWQTSKSEALSRAIVSAAQTTAPDDISAALSTLQEPQQVARVSEAQATAWTKRARDERHLSRRFSE